MRMNACMQGIVHGLLDRLVGRLEALLARKQFNQLGGLQLERDARTLVCVEGAQLGDLLRPCFMVWSNQGMLLFNSMLQQHGQHVLTQDPLIRAGSTLGFLLTSCPGAILQHNDQRLACLLR